MTAEDIEKLLESKNPHTVRGNVFERLRCFELAHCSDDGLSSEVPVESLTPAGWRSPATTGAVSAAAKEQTENGIWCTIEAPKESVSVLCDETRKSFRRHGLQRASDGGGNLSAGEEASQHDNQHYHLVVGTQSAPRRKIIDQIFADGASYEFQVRPIDEKQIARSQADAKPWEVVLHIARAKATALRQWLLSNRSVPKSSDYSTSSRLRREQEEEVKEDVKEEDLRKEGKEEGLGRQLSRQTATRTLLVTGDQVVLYNGQIREKPLSAEEAKTMVQSYSESACSTVGAIALTDCETGFQVYGVAHATISFNRLPQDQVSAFLEDPECFACAGALKVEHPAICPHVSRIEGTLDSVQGFSKVLFHLLVKQLQSKAPFQSST